MNRKKVKKQAQRSSFTLVSYIFFFMAVAAVASVSIISYQSIYFRTNGNLTVTAPVTAAILLVLTFALCLVGAFWRKIVSEKPVKIILAATQKMARGDFAINLKPFHPWGRYDEYDVIMENINAMASELSKSEILRNDFIANVSHEIKTPLSVILNYADALGNPEITPERRAEYAEVLMATARRLTALISNILKLNKLENQKIFPEKQKVRAGELLRECVLSFEEVFERKELEIEADIDDAEIFSDPGFLEIIWNNLLSNAVKFSDRGGKISVFLKESANEITVTVRDNGCGMDARTGEHIFDKFYQGDTSHAGEGNGLGLALVKRVIDILGGRITVESRPGEGSAFAVSLKKE